MNDKDLLLSTLTNFIKQENIALSERLENKIDKHLSSIKYWGIGGIAIFCVVFTAFFGFLFYFVNDQYNTRVERLEISTYRAPEAVILNERRNKKYRKGAVNKKRK